MPTRMVREGCYIFTPEKDLPEDFDLETLAKTCFDTYWLSMEHSWDELADHSKDRWREAAKAVVLQSYQAVCDLIVQDAEEAREATKGGLWVHLPVELIDVLDVQPIQLSRYVRDSIEQGKFRR